jgi:molybdopterin-containing oxidoreductase family membrane subunit
MFVASLLVNVGMWFERFVIVISLEQDYLPSSWAYFKPTWVDVGTLIGSFGLFMTLFLLFIRYLPVVAMAEIKAVMPQAKVHHGHHGGDGREAHAEDEP